MFPITLSKSIGKAEKQSLGELELNGYTIYSICGRYNKNTINLYNPKTPWKQKQQGISIGNNSAKNGITCQTGGAEMGQNRTASLQLNWMIIYIKKALYAS